MSISKKLVFPSGERTIVFVILLYIIIAVTVSLGRSYDSSTCSISLLCIESNALEISLNFSVASRLFAHTLSVLQQIVRMWEIVDWFPRFDFQKIFLDLGLDILEKQTIINHSSYSNTCYTVVYHDEINHKRHTYTNTYSNTQYRQTLLFSYERFISFLTSVHRYEERDTILKSLS